MELIELIIRLIAWMAEGGKKSKRPAQVDPAAMAEWQRRRELWEAEQRRQWAAALQGTPMQPAYAHPATSVAPAKPTPPPLNISAAPVPRSEPPPARPVKPALAVASSIGRWAKPNTLRSQFILTEVLKPPLSLRGQMNVALTGSISDAHSMEFQTP